MKFSEALAAIKALENGADLASAIEGEVEGLKGKNFEIIGEKRNATTKATAYETALTAIASALGIEGDLDAVLTSAEGKVRELVSASTTAQTKLTDLETRATTAEGKVKQAERLTKITQAATKAGANAAVLERLLGDKVDELAIADDGVKIGDKALKEYVEADDALKAFLPALFPSTEQGQKADSKQQRLPGGTPKGTDSKKDLLGSYTERNFSGAKALVKAAE